ncbi:MAG: hypothetical protein QG622_1450 [Actinomycetota bacterium]|nr:hypothetical protein [Actinomycetota bacterium]
MRSVSSRVGRGLPAVVGLLLVLAGCAKAAPVAVDGGGAPAPAAVPSGGAGEGGDAGADQGAKGGKASGKGGARPPVLVGVRTGKGVRGSGALVVLDPSNGSVIRTLDPGLAVGAAVQLSPDRSTVYYEKAIGCSGQIWKVPVAGGSPKKVVDAGNRPALSPDGTKLAYSTQTVGDSCDQGSASYGKSFALVVRSLAEGTTRRLGLPNEQLPLPSPIGRLSWNADGTKIAVSVTSVQDNEGWALRVVDPGTDEYYSGEKAAGSAVPVSGPGTATTQNRESYFREGVFLPGGGLFVVHRCCQGIDDEMSVKPRSELLQEIDPARGALRRQIAVGLTTKDHTSLDSDISGRWLLYLSGDSVMVSDAGAKPVTLTSGYQAVDW